ncbi:MAG TPA: OsmC family protein [Solirubrobacterales bacterium]|nr:OsmC family protein [Solirubrobacterales bacterium]
MHAHVVARRIAGYSHEVDLGDGHEIVVDEPAEDGGTDTGPRPSQLLATSLAGCTAITIELYAKRKGWNLDGLAVAVDMSSVGEGVPPHAVPTHFTVEVGLPAGLDDEQRRKLMVIAEKCPVHRLLEGGAEITVVERAPG